MECWGQKRDQPRDHEGEAMKGELTAIIEKAPEGGFWAICPEVPGANGQGEAVEEAKESLREAVALIHSHLSLVRGSSDPRGPRNLLNTVNKVH